MMCPTLFLYITRDMVTCYPFIMVFSFLIPFPALSGGYFRLLLAWRRSKIDQGCLEAQEPLSMNQSSHSELSGQHPLSQRLGTSIKFPTLFKCYPKQISSTLDKLKCRPSEIPLLKISAVKSHISLLPNRANFLSSRFPHWTGKLPS
jgi:hypothetical protein